MSAGNLSKGYHFEVVTPIGEIRTTLFPHASEGVTAMLSPLRKKRILQEMSIYELGQKAGILPPRISLIERGYVVPRVDEKENLAKAFGCKVTDIFLDSEGARNVAPV